MVNKKRSKRSVGRPKGSTKPKSVSRADFDLAIEMRNDFLLTSQQRGKAIGILLEMTDFAMQDHLTERLAELYDARTKLKEETKNE